MVHMNPDAPTALTAEVFSGHRPTATGDLSVETHGIAPIAEDQRYGRPGRMFTVWFAPQVTMTGVFTGTLAIVLGLGFWLGLLAMTIGTVLGSLVVAYLCTWGPRTGTAQVPNSRMAFGSGVKLPAALQWLSSIAWDGLVGLFGGEALALLLGIPFWVAVLIVLVLQGAVGFFGYELIHRVQAVLTVVLFGTFVVFAVKLVSGHQVITPPTVSGADLAGAFVFEVTIALSLAISWASYAADFSRYLPAQSSSVRVFGFTFAGIVSAYLFVQGIGIAGADLLADHTAEGVRTVMGGGVLGVDRAAGDRAGVGGVQRDERLQRIVGAADHRRSGATPGGGGGGDGAGVHADHVAASRATPRRGSLTCCCWSATGSRRSSRSSSSTGYCGSRAGAASTRHSSTPIDAMPSPRSSFSSSPTPPRSRS